MEKFYSLPDLPLLPYSDTQALLLRLLEYRDFSVLPALFDRLQEEGLYTELADLRKKFGLFLSHWQTGGVSGPPPHTYWSRTVWELLPVLWHLIYSPAAAAEVLNRMVWGKPSSDFTYTAAGVIPAGSVVYFNATAKTVYALH